MKTWIKVGSLDSVGPQETRNQGFRTMESGPQHQNLWVGVPIMAQWKCIQLASMRIQVRSLALLPGVAMSCGVGHRFGLDLTLLWLWRRPAATALI